MTRSIRLARLAAALVLAISVPVTAVGFETPEEAVREYVEAVASGAAKTQPNNVQESEIERILRRYIEQAWAGQLTPADALTQADAEIQAILEE